MKGPVGGEGGDEPVEFIMPGVPNYLWYINCALTAETMILGFWNHQGYESLVPGGNSVDGCPWAITEEICWIEWTGSRVGYYANARELGNAVPFEVKGPGSTEWQVFRDAIETYQTPLGVSWGGVPYGAHSTVGVGFKEDGAQRFLILHDTWVSYPAYVNYDQYAASIMIFRRDSPVDPQEESPPEAPEIPATGDGKGISLHPVSCSFSPGLIPARYSYHCMEGVDIDADGLLDLVICNFSYVGRKALRVFMNRSGQFVEDTNLYPLLERYECLRVAKAEDYDGDGDFDLASAEVKGKVRL